MELNLFKEFFKGIIKECLQEQEAALSKEPTEEPGKPITTNELCEYLDISRPTLLSWRKKKKIPYFMIGSAVRYDLNQVLKAIEK